jgi:D-alanine-D-alanine ligase
MMDQDGEIYLLELNTIPGMTDQSLMPLAAYTYGWIFDELVERLMG